MNEYQEAYKRLTSKEYKYASTESVYEDLETLKPLIDRATPMKPLDIEGPVVKWGLCPVCKGKINEFKGRPNRLFESTNYCPDCGQALCWREEE